MQVNLPDEVSVEISRASQQVRRPPPFILQGQLSHSEFSSLGSVFKLTKQTMALRFCGGALSHANMTGFEIVHVKCTRTLLCVLRLRLRFGCLRIQHVGAGVVLRSSAFAGVQDGGAQEPLQLRPLFRRQREPGSGAPPTPPSSPLTIYSGCP